MNLSFHDAKPGKLDRCQITNRNDLELVIDLGHQPLCDSLLDGKQLRLPEKTFPLRLYRSKSLGHGQLDYIVPGEEVYFPEYPYRPGITKEVKMHHSQRTDETIQDFDIFENSLIVDIGSNDGTLLSFYKKKLMRVVGVEPTNTAKLAKKNGVNTIQKFFDENVAEEIISNHGYPKLVTATNVFAHMSTMGTVIRGIKKLLNDESFFVLENHYIVNILKSNQYDSIYHEHIRSYSLKSLVHLFSLYGMNVINVELVERYGGTIRVTVSKNLNLKPSKNVMNFLDWEIKQGIFEDKLWNDFKFNVLKTKNDLMQIALDANNKGQRFVGKSCPGRCSTLINFVGLDNILMPYISEQPTSLKLGKYLPGKHIPIVDDEILFKENPDYVVIFAWHYGKEIAKDLKSRGLKSKLVLPLPEVSIMK